MQNVYAVNRWAESDQSYLGRSVTPLSRVCENAQRRKLVQQCTDELQKSAEAIVPGKSRGRAEQLVLIKMSEGDV